MKTSHPVSLAALWLVIGCGAAATQESAPPTTATAASTAVSVQSVAVEVRSISSSIDADATLAPSVRAEVTTSAAGTVSALPLAAHTVVAARDVVATITPEHGRATSLRAPIAGELSEARFALGAHVDAHVPVLEITQSDPMLARFGVPESTLPQIHPGQLVRVSLDMFPDRVFEAIVTTVGAIDPSAHVVSIEATLPNPDRSLVAGAGAHVRIQILEHADAIVAPIEAIVTRDGRTLVFVAEGAVARERVVSAGLRDARGIEITSGLADGETVLAPASALHDGDAISFGR